MTQSAALDNETIYQTVVQEILHFRHRPGDMISENTLCQRFGVSRTPARSVLQRLRLLYGENQSLTIACDPGVESRIEIRIPFACYCVPDSGEAPS